MSILAVDIGGTNIRAGIVALNLKKAADLSEAAVWKFELWRHRDEKNSSATRRSSGWSTCCKDSSRRQQGGLKLAPFIGIGCPGIIHADGSIDRAAKPAGQLGEQPLQPAAQLCEAIPKSVSTKPWLSCTTTLSCRA